MNTEQTAQQLELAAQILRTGHPWKSSPQAPNTDLYSALRDGFEIRPILATPPDNRPLHNPDNLTAEQVEVGYRLLTEDEFQEDAHLQHQEWWSISVQPKSWMVEDLGRSRSPELNFGTTYRLPLSVPWSEPKPDPYADEKKTVPLGPEDVPPGSEFRFTSSLLGVSWTRLGANANGVVLHTPGQELNSKKNILRTISWNEMSDMQINRSIPLTGKWNPDAWEPCHKSISENG